MRVYTVVQDGNAWDISGKSSVDAKRQILLKDNINSRCDEYFSESDCKLLGLPNNSTVRLCLSIIRARKAVKYLDPSCPWSQKYGDEDDVRAFDKDETPSLDDLEIFANRNTDYIIANMRDDDVNALFEYLYTGGFGRQWGNPAKEWYTIDVSRNYGHVKTCTFTQSPSLEEYRKEGQYLSSDDESD